MGIPTPRSFIIFQSNQTRSEKNSFCNRDVRDQIVLENYFHFDKKATSNEGAEQFFFKKKHAKDKKASLTPVVTPKRTD